jgi:pimeloyl-ACP methyl ester carboxylesterase
MSTFVLLHGAGVGAWVWDKVMAELSTRSLALEVPGRRPGVTPEECASELVAELDQRGVEGVVLVAHSLAGVLVPAMAQRLKFRLHRCIYVSGVVPPNGRAFVDAFPLVNRLVLRSLFAFNPDGLTPSPKMIRKELCNDLDADVAAEVVSKYAAEFPGLYLTPVGELPMLHTTYIRLLNDQSVTPALQNRMIKRLGSPRVRELNAGHLAMLSMPFELAAMLSYDGAA